MRDRLLRADTCLRFSLMKEAAIEAKQGGERGITARSVKKVTAVSATDMMPAPDLAAHSSRDLATGLPGQV